MTDHDQTTLAASSEKTVLVERQTGSIGGIIAALALLLAVAGVLKYFGMLPF